jgi:hypothetical protein
VSDPRSPRHGGPIVWAIFYGVPLAILLAVVAIILALLA